ncbi:retrovirus-related pol polyprotein from transposon TNT 1-94 [Tanacetum coccineum]
MLSTAKVPLYFWAEVIETTCFTQNRSLVIPRHEKTPYHIINGRKPSVKFFHIFSSLCYIVRDGENLDKIKEKGDECIFLGYSTQSRAYSVATILQISSAILHISNIDYMYIKSYSFRLFSSLPGVLTPVRGESLKILNGFDVSLPVSHLLWSSQSFGHQKAINGFDMPLPVAVCSGLVNPLAPRKGMDWLSKFRAKIVCYEKIVQIPLSSEENLEVHEGKIWYG